MAEAQSDLNHTPLFDLHKRHGARMVPFAGFSMPVQFDGGIIEEHLHTRQRAGLFDVSHMGQIIVHGTDVAAAFERIVPGDIQSLREGQCRYTMLTNDAGGIIDDLIVTHRGDTLHVVLNASRADVDIAHIEAAIGSDVRIERIADRALIALQGPDAAAVMGRYAHPAPLLPAMSGSDMHIGHAVCQINRSGYTGEDGFEISLPADDAETIAEMLLDEPEVAPVGLGARDSLRLEAGLCLYGNDIDEQTTPIEASLAWTISARRREAADFPGAAIILDQLANGPSKKRIGIRIHGRMPARGGAPIIDAETNNTIGTVTSGGFGPCVNLPADGGPIAMGYVDTQLATPGRAVKLMVRKTELDGEIVRLPFVKSNQIKL